MNIFALSSGRGPSGIAIIRISGSETLKICKDLTKLKDIKLNEVNFCKFYDPKNDNIIDPEALLLWFPSPNSYTGEDLAELQIHGSNAVINALLRVLSEQKNCRLAEPGEFTKIAFQNDKIDLLKAESIGDLIHSETELQRQQAVKLVKGNASNYYNNLREKIIKSLAFIEAKIDFSEEDLPDKVLKDAHKSIKEIHSEITKIIEDNKVGEKIRDGFRVSITGEVNAGKSSLLNLLSKREVAIVSDEAGTTRDIVEVRLNLEGVAVSLLDTAGIRETKGQIEAIGIKRAQEAVEQSDLVILMLDGTDTDWRTQSEALAEGVTAPIITVLNKKDIYKDARAGDNILCLSLQDEADIAALEAKIIETIKPLNLSGQTPIITRARHRQLLQKAQSALMRSQENSFAYAPELVGEDLRAASDALGQMTGQIDVEDILDDIFSSFCIGK